MKLLNYDKVLCLSPHPDDVEYGMLGTIMKYKDTKFDIVVLSEGGDFDESTAKERQEECKKVWEHIDNINGHFIEDSKFISGGTKTDERKANYDSASTSDQIVLVCTYGVASVGINIPRIFNLVLVEPGKSFVRVIQSIGRGIRKAEDKDFVQIWDITSTCKFAKRHLTKRKHFYREAKYPFTIEKTEWEN